MQEILILLFLQDLNLANDKIGKFRIDYFVFTNDRPYQHLITDRRYEDLLACWRRSLLFLHPYLRKVS